MTCMTVGPQCVLVSVSGAVASNPVTVKCV